jgi:uncharacterized protein DUF3738
MAAIQRLRSSCSSCSSWLLVAIVGVAGPIETTRAQSAGPRFEVASVRINTSSERPRLRVRAVPDAGRLTITGLLVQDVIQSAYGLRPFELEVFSAAALERRGTTAPSGVDPNGPPLATALVDQLGLKFESKRAPISVVVIDRIDTLILD